ncbi:MAG TPA: copper chaperone PCu(A)C [Pseudomonas xinjiangensis]|uniref:Copper chaperone PCu(A)C n=2 Tax=root TaxID=1 RepID=A0A7V1BLI7_9GAMM|nr:copper chaperone PCu(A)C [Halopseudomonas xinjiangensis]HEC48177.1 copper chaperone PCu(A)C [Halopseudomonas xinjiangensis]
MTLAKWGVMLTAVLISAQLSAHEFKAGDLHIDHPWSRPLPPVAPTGAAYLRIENHGQTADSLLGVRSPIAEYAQMHEHLHVDGLMKMQQTERVDIASGQTVIFEPGGLHIMLFDLREPLVSGDEFPLTLDFEKAGAVEVIVKIGEEVPEPAGSEPPHDSGAHQHH